MESRVSELEIQVDSLREEVRELRLALQRVRRELDSRRRSDSEADRVSSYSSVLDSALRAPNSASYSLVTGGGDGGFSRGSSAGDSRAGLGGGASRGVASYSRSPAASGSASARPTISWEEREEICDEIAEWFQRCIRGEHRGSSGRDRIPLASRVWIVAKDFDGFLYRPCQVFHTFGECKHLVKRGSECGESVFIGVPSEREARRIVSAAQLGWPTQDYRDGGSRGRYWLRLQCRLWRRIRRAIRFSLLRAS